MPAGRPTAYKAEFCDTIASDASIQAEGATDAAIALALNVDRSSVHRWRGEHPEFAEACAAVKQVADDKVEASLFQRSVGYSHSAVKIFMPAGAPQPVYAPFTEHYPPDTAAASLWLRNRKSGEWRDKIEHTGPDGGAITLVIKRAGDDGLHD